MKTGILLKKITRNLCDYGVFTTTKKSFFYLLKPVYERVVYRVYSIDLEKLRIQEIGLDEFTYKIITLKDQRLIKTIESMEEFLHGQLGGKLEKNGLCLVALDGENVAGFNLIGFGEVFIHLLQYKKILKMGEAWSEQITVHKDYRRRGLGSKLRYRIFSELKDRGIKKLYGGTLRSNEASLRLARKVGFEVLKDVHYRKILGFKKYWCEEVR